MSYVAITFSFRPYSAAARKMGRRHGRSVILLVESGARHHDGYTFYRSANGV